jgi:AraC-like DNA-binding protein
MTTVRAPNPVRNWLADWVGRAQLIANRMIEGSVDQALNDLRARTDDLPSHAEAFAQLVVRHVVCRALSGIAERTHGDAGPDVTQRLMKLLGSPIADGDWREPLRETIELCNGALARPSVHLEVVDPALAQVISVLDSRFRDPTLSLSALAKDVNLSPWHVVRLLRAHTGRGFVAHLRERRVAEAERLMRETRLNGKQIAAEVGYRHARQLGRDFLQIRGVTPTAFRKTLLPARASAMARLIPAPAKKGQK